jgi:hypothetical protein
MRKSLLVALCALLALASDPVGAQIAMRPQPAYDQVATKVAGMVGDPEARRLAAAKGLGILNVMWEDTGRYQGSSVGPNISDVTIEVHVPLPNGGTRPVLMPVIRYPNFTDKTADIKLEKLFLRVGNQTKGGRLEVITLKEFLARPTRYLSMPRKGSIVGNTLLAPRDAHLLVSAQSAFLPIPRTGQAKFYPTIFNYQSYRQNPAVLTLLVTRQGTSATVIDNSRDTVGSRGWGQRLFFNQAGKRAPLIAERLSDVAASGTTRNGEAASSLGEDANLLMLVQIPLKVKQVRRQTMFYGLAAPSASGSGGAPESARVRRGGSNVEAAVLGHGAVEGPYTELDGLTIERDPRFPVRVTVQFYQATSNGVISAADMERLHAQIANVYGKGDYVGSLVVPERGVRRAPRPTEWTGIGPAPRHLTVWDFPGLVQYLKDTGRFFLFPWTHPVPRLPVRKAPATPVMPAPAAAAAPALTPLVGKAIGIH